MTSNLSRIWGGEDPFLGMAHPFNLYTWRPWKGSQGQGLGGDSNHGGFSHRVLKACLNDAKMWGKASLEMGSLQM